MPKKFLQDQPSKKILKGLHKYPRKARKLKYLNEGIQRALLEDGLTFYEVLDPLFKGKEDKQKLDSLNLLSVYVKSKQPTLPENHDYLDSVFTEEHLMEYSNLAELLSLNYFNPFSGVDDEFKFEAIDKLSIFSGASFKANKDKYFALSLAAAASLELPEVFLQVIDEFNHYVSKGKKLGVEYELKDLEKIAIRADYSRHGLYKLHNIQTQNNFLVGATQNMLYSSFVLDGLDILDDRNL